MLSKIFFGLSIVLFGHLHLFGQTGLVASYGMDNCMLTDDAGGLDGLGFGLSCACGVRSNGLTFGPGEGFAQFDPTISDVLMNDWSISFYVKVDNQGAESVDILFMGERCGLDSILSLRYLPSSRIFRFRLSDSPNNEVDVDGNYDDNSCWQYIVLTKDGAVVRMYINGILVGEDDGRSSFALNIDAVLSISNSPCQDRATNADVDLLGDIDEFKIYDRPLTSREIGDSYLLPDKILTSDTTVFLGTSIRIQTGGSCSDDFTWSPESFLDNPNQLNPVSTPTENITYTLTVNDENCSSVEEINVRVADQGEVTCEDLLLPSAFTPNNDRINDEFGISNKFLINELSSFEIFNRWGGRVFFTNSIEGTWDGVYQGAPAPATSYVYKVVYLCGSEIFTKTGALNLIR